jgi:hypothetical protein
MTEYHKHLINEAISIANDLRIFSRDFTTSRRAGDIMSKLEEVKKIENES